MHLTKLTNTINQTEKLKAKKPPTKHKEKSPNWSSSSPPNLLDGFFETPGHALNAASKLQHDSQQRKELKTKGFLPGSASVITFNCKRICGKAQTTFKLTSFKTKRRNPCALGGVGDFGCCDEDGMRREDNKEGGLQKVVDREGERQQETQTSQQTPTDQSRRRRNSKRDTGTAKQHTLSVRRQCTGMCVAAKALSWSQMTKSSARVPKIP